MTQNDATLLAQVIPVLSIPAVLQMRADLGEVLHRIKELGPTMALLGARVRAEEQTAKEARSNAEAAARDAEAAEAAVKAAAERGDQLGVHQGRERVHRDVDVAREASAAARAAANSASAAALEQLHVALSGGPSVFWVVVAVVSILLGTAAEAGLIATAASAVPAGLASEVAWLAAIALLGLLIYLGVQPVARLVSLMGSAVVGSLRSGSLGPGWMATAVAALAFLTVVVCVITSGVMVFCVELLRHWLTT